MIPEDNIPAAVRGLTQAFGVESFDDVQDLTDRPGSNRAFRIVVRGSPYLLRINTRKGDMARHFTCMQAAADAALAPRVHYASVEDRLSITDFVRTAAFPAADALRSVPALLRKLHAMPAFPTAPFNTTCTWLLNKGPAVDGFLRSFRSSNILPSSDVEEFFGQYERLAAVCSSLDPDLVPSHNDLFKPDNILFDGVRPWLVDWEAAFQNDRYADLSAVANVLVTDDAEEHVLLEEYCGAPPDSYQAARFHLMRQLAHVFYAMAFLSQGAAEKPIDWSEPIPAYRDFQRQFWDGGFRLTENRAKALYGRVHWDRLTQNLRQPRYDEALRTVLHRRTVS